MFAYTDARWECNGVSIGVVVAPGPVFVLLFFLGFGVFVVLAMLFGEETAPRGLFVLIPLAVITVFLSSGGRRLDEKSGAERGGQGCGKQNRGEMLLGFLHENRKRGPRTIREVPYSACGVCVRRAGKVLRRWRELFRRVGGMRMNSMAIRRSMRL